MDELPEIILPAVGDELFTDAPPDWRSNACLNFDPDMWIGYIAGYNMAGRLLVDHVVATGVDQDFLVYPIVFTYRHALELQMKQLIRSGMRLLDIDGDFEPVHRLVPLWSACRKVLEQVWPSSDLEALDAIGQQVTQLASLDEGSFAFRYPEDRKGAPSLPRELQRFNLRHFAGRMDRICQMLDGASSGISVFADFKSDAEAEGAAIRAEYRAEMQADAES